MSGLYIVATCEMGGVMWPSATRDATVQVARAVARSLRVRTHSTVVSTLYGRYYISRISRALGMGDKTLVRGIRLHG